MTVITRRGPAGGRAAFAAACALAVTGCGLLLGNDFDVSRSVDSGAGSEAGSASSTTLGDGAMASECADSASCGTVSTGDAAGVSPDGSIEAASMQGSPDGGGQGAFDGGGALDGGSAPDGGGGHDGGGAPPDGGGAPDASDGGGGSSCGSCAGCCNGSTCELGTANDACGTGGGACRTCSSPLVCSSGSCGVCSGLIDDTTSNTPEILASCGRTGEWFSYGDSAGVEVPALTVSDGGPDTFLKTAVGSGGPASYAVHLYGSGFAVDVGTGTTLGGRPDFTNVAYDATSYGYTGISFYVMKGTTVAGASSLVAVQITDKDSDPAGGLCSTASSPPAGTGCYDSARSILTLPSTWTLVSLPFTSFAKSGRGYGGSTALDATSIYTIEFEVSGQAGESPPFAEDIWVADLSFTP